MIMTIQIICPALNSAICTFMLLYSRNECFSAMLSRCGACGVAFAWLRYDARKLSNGMHYYISIVKFSNMIG
jgi:hypothetical protein